LAEYYMGHKLGDNAKTTYIQVNRLDNKLFVDEYAQPVIAMLDKYVFYRGDELKKLQEETEKEMLEYVDSTAAKMKQGLSLTDICIDYNIRGYEAMRDKEIINMEKKNHYERI
jgi:hypothetical protein